VPASGAKRDAAESWLAVESMNVRITGGTMSLDEHVSRVAAVSDALCGLPRGPRAPNRTGWRFVGAAMRRAVASRLTAGSVGRGDVQTPGSRTIDTLRGGATFRGTAISRQLRRRTRRTETAIGSHGSRSNGALVSPVSRRDQGERGAVPPDTARTGKRWSKAWISPRGRRRSRSIQHGDDSPASV
jgi:hypothetical protein